MSDSDPGTSRIEFDSNFIGVTARLARVPEQIEQLRVALDEFAVKEPAILAAGYKETNGQPRYSIPHPSTWLPQEAQVIAGEIVHNLRSTLDNLIWMLAYRNSGHEVKNTQFPIAYSRQEFDQQRKRRLKGLTPTQIDVIEKLQPYNGGVWLQMLAELSNPDKHRHLILIENVAKLDIVFTGRGVEIPPRPPEWSMNKKYEPVPTLQYLHDCVERVARHFMPPAS